MILQTASIFSISRDTLKILLLIFGLYWLYSLTQNYYVLGYNPNGAACIVFYLCMILISLSNAVFNNYKIKRIVNILIIITTIINIYKYNCRNITIVLIGLGIISLVNLVKFFNNNKKRLVNTIFLLITIGSLLITKAYIFLFQHGMSINLSFFRQKDFFSGREIIWINLYNGLRNNILFGIGTKSIWFPNNGAHNYMLNVLSLFGVPHFLVFMFLIYNYLKKLFKVKFDVNNIFCFMSILSLFVTEFFEASLVGGRKLFVLFILTNIFFSTKGNGTDEEKD